MKKKRRYRQAAAFLLAAVLILSTGTGSPVFAEAEETEPVTGQEQVTETGTEASKGSESETETEPVTEPESSAETETVTEGETSGESETETEPVTEKEPETQKTPQVQVQSASPAQNQILTVSEIDEAVQNVQDQIDALPTAAEVEAMNQEEQQNTYMQAQSVWDAYDALTAEQQAQVDESKLTELLDYFNGQVAVTAGTNQPAASSVAEVVMNGSITYYDTLNEAVQTVSNAGGTATITLLKNASLTGYNSSPIYGNITLIGGTHTISGDNLGIIIAGTLTVMSGTFERALLYSAGTINIYGGIYYAVSSSANNAQGTVNIYGGTFNIVDALSGGTINIYGGSISDIRGNVNYPVTNISLSPSSLTLAPETTQSLTATISPEIAASHATVSWSSSNENVAKISGSGTTVTVTAGAPGTAKITASAGGKEATCTVTVKGTTTINNKAGGSGYPINFTYGDVLPTPTANYFDISGSSEGFSYQWYSGNQTTGELTGGSSSAPTGTGTYTLVVATKDSDTYTGGELRLLVTIADATYKVTIPASATAGGSEVSITTSDFQIGTNGRVRVKISSGAQDGAVTLTRQNDGTLNPPTITSALLNGMNGSPLANGDTVALYDASQKLLENTTGKLFFKAPTETNIAAGTYSGTVAFEISYEIQQN